MTDKKLAKKYGGFISMDSDSSPSAKETYGESATEEFDRLLRIHIQPQKRTVDLGCGAGQITCMVAEFAKEIWGVDSNTELVQSAKKLSQARSLKNVHFLQGDKNDTKILNQIPNELDVIYSRRGPNLDATLAQRLIPGGIFLQLLVSEFDGYPLKEILGRRDYSPYHFADEHALMVHYARMSMEPISIKSYSYHDYFRNIDHLEAYLTTIPANLRDYRLLTTSYDKERDRAALQIYANYNMTSKGIRLLRHRRVFALRKVTPIYPIDRSNI